MNQLATINQQIKSDQVLGRVVLAIGHDKKDAKVQARSYAASVLAEVEKSQDLQACRPDSIIQCMIDAAKFGLKIDGRQQAHLVPFKGVATMQIGYRGFLAKLREHYDDVDFVVEPVFDGDTFNTWDENGYQKYQFRKKNPFNQSLDSLQGVFVAISYRLGETRTQKVTVMPKEEIEKVKGVAKTKDIWNKWYLEKAKVAAIKRACKIHFASVMNDIIEYDNENNFEMKEVTPKGDGGASIVEAIKTTEEDFKQEEPKSEAVEYSSEADFAQNDCDDEELPV